jgi:dGTPase
MSTLYSKTDWEREISIENVDSYRDPWRRDYARLLHSPSFRRLQGKTQLFPGNETDYFRNRLTHSLEVAQIAKSIAIKLNNTEEFLKEKNNKIKYDLCEFAGLAHDLGHPPFGHNGEQALDLMMINCGGYEGNAQTLRILSKLEKKEGTNASCNLNNKDCRCGLNSTYRSLASVLKYDKKIPNLNVTERKRPIKGYYENSDDLVQKIKSHVAPNYTGNFKTIECSIMDLADDIAYSTYDIEDAFKAGFISPLSVISLKDDTISLLYNALDQKIEHQEIKDILFWAFGGFVVEDEKNQSEFSEFTTKIAQCYSSSNDIAQDGFLRCEFTSSLVNIFINNIVFVPNEKFPMLSIVKFKEDVFNIVEVLKKFAFVTIINSPKLRIVEFRGTDIVTKIFHEIKESASNPTRSLLPYDYRHLYNNIGENEKDRVICDFIAGMTDRYAIEFYGRIFSDHPQTIFKPL